MQFLDIAVATGYAAICLSLIVMMSPVAAHESAVDDASRSVLDHAILAYVQRVGLPFLTASSQEAVCASAAEASNATVGFDVVVQGSGCPSAAAPLSPLASSSLTLDLPGRAVVIDAWLVRQ